MTATKTPRAIPRSRDLPDLQARREADAALPLKREAIHDHDIKTLTRSERVIYAAKLVVWEGWTRKLAAQTCGVSYETLRRHLNDKGLADKLESELAVLQAGELVDAEIVQDAVVGWRDTEEQRQQWYGWIRSSRRVGLPWDFINTYFGHVVCPDCECHHPMPDFHYEMLRTWHHKDTRRFLTNVPPYHAKTTLWSVWDTIYDSVRDPNNRTIVVSKTNDFVRAIIYGIQEWLTNHDLYDGARRNLIDDFGPFKVGDRSWMADQFYIAGKTSSEKDPTVLGIGVGQQVYGRRADKVKNDDVATIENQGTPDRVQKLLSWSDKELLSRIGSNGKAGWMGTRVMPGDMYGIMSKRLGWQTFISPAIIRDDHDDPEMLWGEHFSYEDALARRAEMSDADFQMVYQQVDLGTEGLAYKAEDVHRARDHDRATGQYENSWQIVAGVDLAGSRKNSGYTVVYVHGVDPGTEQRYAIDIHREQGMTPDKIRNVMFGMADTYPIVEFKVEANAIQEQIVQMNNEIVRPLASRGVRITGHQTQGNKWDKSFGVESSVPLFIADPSMMSIPWATERDRHIWTPFIDEITVFPLGPTSDTVMAFWFAELAAREWLRRKTVPLFTTQRVPEWVAKRRKIVRRTNAGVNTVERVPLSSQRQGMYRSLGRIQMNEPVPDPREEW